MKILHGPQNIGGMAGVLVKAQRQCGVDAFSYCLPTSSFQYPADRIIQATGVWGRTSELLAFFLREGLGFDAFQFYFGTSYAGLGLHEVQFLKFLGKKVFFYFCGCDIRDSKLTIAKYQYNACSECWPMLCSPNRKQALKVAERYADAVFVSTPDLLEFVPGAVLLPQPIDMEVFGRLRDAVGRGMEDRTGKDANTVRIAHAPSSRAIKGSKYLIRAVDSMRMRGIPVELTLIEGKTYEEAMRICASADIVVDQLLVGAYGQFAVEMMALGKPVVCFIREDLWAHYPSDLPIISATPNDIESILEGLVAQRDRWPELGRRGIDYVERHHDSLVVARRTLDYYRARRG